MLDVTYPELDFFRSDWWRRDKGLQYKTLLQMTDCRLVVLFIEFWTPIFCDFSSLTPPPLIIEYIIIRVETMSKNIEHSPVIYTVILTYKSKKFTKLHNLLAIIIDDHILVVK